VTSPPPGPERGADGGPGHYFAPDPTARSRLRSLTLALPDGIALDLTTDSGVFSADRVDPGTRALLAEGPPVRGTTLLDLGCGYGPIACALARRAGPDATVWAVDVNRRALGLCARNAEANGVADQVRVAEPADVPTDVRFDQIWSNPPIRVGKAMLHQLLSDWLGRLAAGGEALLVVQKNLGADSLARWLAEAGWPTERLGSRMGYRLLRSVPTSGATS
jgi:16S rRNA (guanine1207-N2)-methyltransferase